MAISTEDGIVAGLISPIPFFKASVTNKQAALPHAVGFTAAGFPSTFTPGSPGLAGATVDGTTNTLGGTIPFTNPGSGNTYLAKLGAVVSATTVALDFFDFLWYNSGISSTTTAGQTINSVTLPARDNAGTTNGAGVTAWLYVSSQTTSANTTATITYTNSAGTGSRTGTISLGGLPATGTVGTLVPFSLAAGDVGVRSIQTLTLNTTLTAGTVNLIMLRDICFVPFLNVSTGNFLDWAGTGFPQLYNGTALSMYAVPTSTTVGAIQGHVTFAQG